MTLETILAAVSKTAEALVAFWPPAQIGSIAAGVIGSILATLHQPGVQVVDENGNPVDLPTLAARVQDKFNHTLANAMEGSRIAQDELDNNPPPAPPPA